MDTVIGRPAQQAPAPYLARAGHLEVRVADRPDEVDQALRLRYQVFRNELGAQLYCGANESQDLDRDVFDPYCRHLIAYDQVARRVVGTYRVLLPEQARELGFIYADREFVLSWLNPIRHELVEMGRACIEPGYRNGVVLMLLWRAMREFVARHAHQYVIGCCSVSVADGGALAAQLYRQLAPAYLAPANQRVWPRNRLPIEALAGPSRPGGMAAAGPVEVPPLLKGYLKAGARILGEPHVDPQFGCADFPIMLEVRSLDQRLMTRLSQT